MSKQRKYYQKYKKEWEKENEFIGWLAPCPGDNEKAVCKYCKCILAAHKKGLYSHKNTKKHIYCASLKSDPHVPVNNFFKPTYTNARKTAEIKLAAFVAEHCSVNCVDHLGELIKKLGEGSDSLREIRLHRTKCTAIIRNVIASIFLKQCLTEIGDSPFSLIIDESTSIDNKKILCLIIKYFSMTTGKITTTLYRLLEIQSGSSEAITNSIISTLKSDGLDVRNLLGIGVDGANAMIGKNNSVSSRLKELVPHIVTVKCICHSLHLAAEKAIKVLPSEIEFITRETSSWFSHSTKRQIEYATVHSLIMERSPNKIDKLSGTRWLARYGAIEKISEQWDALHLHFKLAATNEKCYTALLLSKMYNKENKFYFLFLKDILKPVIKLNKTFQAENMDQLKLYEDLKDCYLGFLQKIVHADILANEQISTLTSFNFEKFLIPSECFNFAYSLTQLLTEIFNTVEIKENCRNFIIELCQQLKQRLPDNINIMEQISIFSPENAQNTKKPDITDIAVHFKNIIKDIDGTLEEWKNLHNVSWNNTCSSEKFWYEVRNKKDACDQQRFSKISKLASALLALPFSNATVERAFSMFSIIKNKIRNRMATATVESILRVRYSLSKGCQNFTPSPEMIKLFTYQNMYVDERDENVLDIFNDL